jgi:hypothetical protein
MTKMKEYNRIMDRMNEIDRRMEKLFSEADVCLNEYKKLEDELDKLSEIKE